jgi:DNA-binding transcriptional regulator YdaS (Cro superfamily)
MTPYQHLIYEFGSAIELARQLKIHRITVNRWKKSHVPLKRVREIEQLTNYSLTRQMLRPDLIKPKFQDNK